MHNFGADLEDWPYPQYAERAETCALIEALRSSVAWETEGFNKVMVALWGDYTLSKVVRVSRRDEVEKDNLREPAEESWWIADALDLRSALAA